LLGGSGVDRSPEAQPTGFLVLTEIVVGGYHGHMLDLAVIEDPAAAEVSLDPVRVRLLAELAETSTATMLATRLGLPRQNVNYHLKALERHGLVELREERRKGNVTERLLQATALSYVISPMALAAVGVLGFFVRMATILFLMIALNRLDWFSPTAFAGAVVPATAVLLMFEMKVLSGRMQVDMGSVEETSR